MQPYDPFQPERKCMKKTRLASFATLYCAFTIASVGIAAQTSTINVAMIAESWEFQPQADTVRLLFDQAHGEQPPPGPMDAIAKKLGLEIQTSAQPINAESLKGVRILYLRAPSKEFTAAETEAIVAFVKGGGSLLLVLDEERRQSLEKTGVNNLITPFGMRLTPDTEYLHNCGGIAKAGEINKAARELPFSGGRAVEGGTAFAFQLDKDGKPAQPFGAYKRVDNRGRIVVLGEGMASLFLGAPNGVRLTGVPNDPTGTTYWGKDSAIFMEELLMWLSR
jgi:hypothetical protein